MAHQISKRDIKKMTKILDRVKDKVVRFAFYRNNELWYVCEDGFEFPVPVSDTGDGTFKDEDKAMVFMRWIRKHMELIETAKAE